MNNALYRKRNTRLMEMYTESRSWMFKNEPRDFV